jgi:TPR repeat protein
MDIAMGLRLLKKAAENGSDAALLLLGDIYNENKEIKLY